MHGVPRTRMQQIGSITRGITFTMAFKESAEKKLELGSK